MRHLVASVVVTLAMTLDLGAQQPTASDPDRWEPAIQKFEAEDNAKPPTRGGILFIGASSIARWNLAESFPDLNAVNRGFGGSEMADSARYAARVVLPHAPRVVVLYPERTIWQEGPHPIPSAPASPPSTRPSGRHFPTRASSPSVSSQRRRAGTSPTRCTRRTRSSVRTAKATARACTSMSGPRCWERTANPGPSTSCQTAST